MSYANQLATCSRWHIYCARSGAARNAARAQRSERLAIAEQAGTEGPLQKTSSPELVIYTRCDKGRPEESRTITFAECRYSTDYLFVSGFASALLVFGNITIGPSVRYMLAGVARAWCSARSPPLICLLAHAAASRRREPADVPPTLPHIWYIWIDSSLILLLPTCKHFSTFPRIAVCLVTWMTEAH